MASDAGQLARSHLVDAASTQDRQAFALFYGAWPVLVVRVPADQVAFERDLGLADAATAMSYRTEPSTGNVPSGHRSARGTRQDRVSGLSSFLCSARGFALCLRKRLVSSSPYPDRISVGRARNQDIVLRHPSVSKFHAWFESDEARALRLADAESTNASAVNDTKLEPRVKAPVEPGDVVRFGLVEAFLCEPEDLWEFLHKA